MAPTSQQSTVTGNTTLYGVKATKLTAFLQPDNHQLLRRATLALSHFIKHKVVSLAVVVYFINISWLPSQEKFQGKMTESLLKVGRNVNHRNDNKFHEYKPNYCQVIAKYARNTFLLSKMIFKDALKVQSDLQFKFKDAPTIM